MKAPKLAYVVSLLLATTWVALASFAGRAPDVQMVRPLAAIPDQIEGWIAGSHRLLDPRVENKLAAADYIDRTYFRNGVMVEVFAAYYPVQRPGNSAHSPKHCLPGSGWEISNYGAARVLYGGEHIPVSKLKIQNQMDRRLVIYWYQTRRQILASEYLSKWFLIFNSLRHGDPATAIVRLVVADRDGAEEKAIEFASLLIPEIEGCLRARPSN